jgi:hypothetical protein
MRAPWCGVVWWACVRACVALALAAPTGPCCGWQSRGPDVRQTLIPGLRLRFFRQIAVPGSPGHPVGGNRFHPKLPNFINQNTIVYFSQNNSVLLPV